MARPASAGAEAGKRDLLLMVRGLAALSVVLWHAGGYLRPYPDWINTPGRTAVWLFFGISGYVIAHGFVHGRYGLNTRDLKDFYVNRFLRIYPIFFALTLLGWVTETVRLGASPIALADLPAQLFAVQFNQHYDLNGVFWTLGIELHFYLLAPLLVLPLLSDRRLWYFWVSTGFYLATVLWMVFAVRKLGWSYDGRNIVACLPHFLAGMIACRMTARMPTGPRAFALAAFFAVLLVTATNLLYHRWPHHFWSWKGMILVDAAIVSIIVAHARWQGGGNAWVLARMTTLGVLSYGLYAWHGYWMKAVPLLVEHAVPLTVISLACAYVTHQWIERPALRLKRVHEARESAVSGT